MLLIIPKAQYKQMIALRRLIVSKLSRDGQLSEELTNSLYYLGSNHGFCRDEVQELIEDCRENFHHYHK